MSILSVIKSIWKVINLIREIFLNLIFLIIIILVISGITFVKEIQKKETVPQKGALVLDIEGVIVDNTPYSDDFYTLQNKIRGTKINTSRENSLFILTQKIAQATNDPNINSIILKLDNFVGTDMTSLQYIGKYLSKFSDAKKPIYAIGSNFNQSQYYLASYADKIYLNPQGAINVYGLSANNLYYKTLLDNLKVNTHIFRVGTYKSAVEPFIRDNMSQEAKSNTSRWLTLMWDNYLNDIAIQRKHAATQLVPSTDIMLSELKNVNGSMSQYALSNGLIDVISSNYEFELDLISPNKVSIYDYQLSQGNEQSEKNKSKPVIAVVFINGTLTESEDNNKNNKIADSRDIIEQLQKIRNNLLVEAIVLRVNSPGGSVEASEAIRQELEAIRAQHIPVVVSMGEMAASGGYWISTESDYIIANPNTITGSIGIFGIIPTFEKSLSSIGIYSDGVATSPLSNISLVQDLPQEVNQLIQINIENGYNTFISLVAKARNMTTEQVDKIGQGQVWLGTEASKNGLVDKLGDIDDAIEIAATLANLSDYQIDWQKHDDNWFDAFYSDISTVLPRSVAEILFEQMPEVKQLRHQVSLWDKFHDAQNRYVYCLNCADVR
ncbi:signal peptide peptidase SppA [Gilliamella sp. wkB112]|uniref:signal peptide peptidase SppA n=1 Tax=Gilliamella sp. wkB112 TaxID=3120257 RepID=UPI00080E9AAB|nr:signal peptide peptidase SppA [Gilliamella apicola]OCG04718.1 signal peptide peptidase SppA [Gilliamella apicola]